MDNALRQRIDRIDSLVQQLKASPDPATRDGALELVQTLMDFHAAGLNRLMELMDAAGDAGWAIVDSFERDELVANMLLLHGLHPAALDSRVQQALEKVRPLLQSHGGNVELVEIADGVVRLRLVGSCDGCSSSTITIKTAIEESIHEFAPDVILIEVIGGKHGGKLEGARTPAA